MLSVDINSISILDEQNHRPLLADIKFDIGEGKVYTILGKNGSGKSTLIKSLTSLLSKDEYATSGKVFLNETDLLNCSKEKLREIRKHNIRYVFQDAVNSLDPLKKIKYYFDLTNVSSLKIEELLLYFLLPNYKKLSGLYSYELSGATSGVDYAVMNLILLKIKNYVRDNDKSVLIVTQDINFAIKSSDYMAYLSDGKLTKFYSKNEFTTSSDVNLKNFIQSFKEISNVST